MHVPKIIFLLILVILGISVSLILLQNKPTHDAAKTHKISNENETHKVPETTKPTSEETAQARNRHGDEWHAEPHPTDEQTDMPTPQHIDGASSKTDPTEDTDTHSGISSINTVSPDITTQTPPDDYHGDPLYWIPSVEYETNRTTAGDFFSDPVIPSEKRDRIDDVHNLRWREESKHLTQEERDRIEVEIFAEGMPPLDVAKFIVVTGEA